VISSESLRVDSNQIRYLQKLVNGGESATLEFKRKASHPDKIVKEIIAFANTAGGTLLIGVSDDLSIPGVNYPEEEWLVIRKAMKNFCKPGLFIEHKIIALTEKKFVVSLTIPHSNKRPHRFLNENKQTECYIRFRDKSVKASPEMQEIIRRSKFRQDIQFTYGDEEKKLIHYLADNDSITLSQFQKTVSLNRFKASRILVTLVLANVLKITPTEKGDLYSRV
jgi:predicted HTH transcriptional regulator